ncbi:MAG: SAM-dependent methyltransferase [Planctomycetota bacterium]|jgi:23S rRNA (cytidine1920-2'-O)/16S rRNA (cytidine1409-2'-O)-methyltransferase
MEADPQRRYVSRGGEKLAAALDQFHVDPDDWVCADLGSNVGGFVDCLLQRGARKVYAIDTGYGELAWKLRRDQRVVVMERTNALHVELPEAVSLVTVDVSWTRQHLILPRARRLLAPGGLIIALIKPHYEADQRLLRRGVLPDDRVEGVVQQVIGRLGEADIEVADLMDSPLRGQGGNREVFALVGPDDAGSGGERVQPDG